MWTEQTQTAGCTLRALDLQTHRLTTVATFTNRYVYAIPSGSSLLMVPVEGQLIEASSPSSTENRRGSYGAVVCSGPHSIPALEFRLSDITLPRRPWPCSEIESQRLIISQTRLLGTQTSPTWFYRDLAFRMNAPLIMVSDFKTGQLVNKWVFKCICAGDGSGCWATRGYEVLGNQVFFLLKCGETGATGRVWYTMVIRNLDGVLVASWVLPFVVKEGTVLDLFGIHYDICMLYFWDYSITGIESWEILFFHVNGAFLGRSKLPRSLLTDGGAVLALKGQVYLSCPDKILELSSSLALAKLIDY